MTAKRGLRRAMPFVVLAVLAGSLGPALAAPEQGHGASQSLLSGISVTSSRDVWAVGEYDVPGRPAVTLTEHWDGTRWKRIPSPNAAKNTGSSLAAVETVSRDDVWAVGAGYGDSPGSEPLIEHWNGKAWKVVAPGPVPDSHVTRLNAITAISPTDVWAVGTYDDDLTHYTHALIEHWDGATWRNIPAAEVTGLHQELDAVTGTSRHDVWAVGSCSAGGRQVTLVEHWDGTQWSRVPSPNPTRGAAQGVTLNSAVALDSDDVWAVGTGSQSYRVTTPVIERWDGAAWHIVHGVNLPQLHGVELTGVSASSPTDVWAVGDSVYPSSTFVERWNGSSWARIPSPNPVGSSVNDLVGVDVRSAHDAWAVGRQNTDATFQPLYLQWDGDRWAARG